MSTKRQLQRYWYNMYVYGYIPLAILTVFFLAVIIFQAFAIGSMSRDLQDPQTPETVRSLPIDHLPNIASSSAIQGVTVISASKSGTNLRNNGGGQR